MKRTIKQFTALLMAVLLLLSSITILNANAPIEDIPRFTVTFNPNEGEHTCSTPLVQ